MSIRKNSYVMHEDNIKIQKSQNDPPLNRNIRKHGIQYYIAVAVLGLILIWMYIASKSMMLSSNLSWKSTNFNNYLYSPTIIQEIPVAENWTYKDEFYSSEFPANETSTTIIFNVFRGDPKALEMQVRMAAMQEKVVTPDIWVMIFNSPTRHQFEATIENLRLEIPQIKVTASDFNFKFHGRFLLASMATTKYVLLVDDDTMIDKSTVYDFIQHMKMQPGLWGNRGHLRGEKFDFYKSWPLRGYGDLIGQDYAEQDYLSSMWFFEQSWLEYFMKERMPSWATSEDMHFSHVMRKYLNLNTYGGKVALLDVLGKNPVKLPGKGYAATKGHALELREYIFDHQLGRGNKVVNVSAPLDTLIYAETVGQIDDFIQKINNCNEGVYKSSSPFCQIGKTAVVFRGAKEQNVPGMIQAAEKLCILTNCEYYSIKPKIKHVIRYFNMREGFGQSTTDIPWQTAASDVLMSFVGILNNILPNNVFIPDVRNHIWTETTALKPERKRNRLAIYHSTMKLALQIHKNTRVNPHLDEPSEYPEGMKSYMWRPTSENIQDSDKLYEELHIDLE